jgi:hypothetical protein
MANRKSGAATLRDVLVCIVLLAAILLAGIVIYRWTTSTLIPATPGSKELIDYTNVVVILLTTVTVLFTVAALALALLGAVGVRNMKRSAEEYARNNVATEIDRAFDQGGAAYDEIRKQFQDPDHAMHRWLRNEIERQVKEQAALYGVPQADVDEDDPADEGAVT